jgi:hypothetical protein
MKKWFVGLGFSLCVALVACPTPVDPNKISSIEVSPSTLSLEVGQSASGLSAVAKNASGNTVSGAVFTWSSSDPSMLQVDSSSGKVTALKGGAAQIQASSDGVQGAAGISVSFTLRVRAQSNGNSPVTVFVSKADGTLIESKSVEPKPDLRNNTEVLEFSNLPGDALVTAGYQIQKPVGGTVGSLTRLLTYSAAYANGQGFYMQANNEFIGGLYAKLEKPTGAAYVRRILPQSSTSRQSFGNGDPRDLPATFQLQSSGPNNQSFLLIGLITDATVTPNKGKLCYLSDFSNVNRYFGLALQGNNALPDFTSGNPCSLRRVDGVAMGTGGAFSIAPVGTVYELEMGGLGFYRITLEPNTNTIQGQVGVGTARPYVAPYQEVYTSDLQKDGLYSTAFIAYDTNDNPVAYKFLKNRTMPASGVDSLEVKANEWQTDLTQTIFTVNVGTDGGYYCPSITGYFGGIESAGNFDCRNNNTNPFNGSHIMTRKYVPGFDKYGFTFGFFKVIASSSAGAPSIYTYLNKRDLATLPTTVSLNASTDFMPLPDIGAVSGVGTARPGIDWTYSGDQSKLEQTTVSIYERDKQSGNNSVQQPGFEYSWFFSRLAPGISSFAVPELPNSISTYAPLEGSRKFRISVSLLEATSSTSRREAAMSRNLNNDTGFHTAGASARALSFEPQVLSDAYQIVLK